MRFRAEAYHTDTEDLAEDLGHWETRRAAQQACEQHAGETLVFSERWRGCWEARAEGHWYRIIGGGR